MNTRTLNIAAGMLMIVINLFLMAWAADGIEAARMALTPNASLYRHALTVGPWALVIGSISGWSAILCFILYYLYLNKNDRGM